MQAYEFTATITPDGKVEIPADLSAKLPHDRPIHIIALVADEDEAAWQRLAAEQFLAGYAEADAIYDQAA